MKIANAKQIIQAKLSDIRIKTKKDGKNRCEHSLIYDRIVKVVDNQTRITLYTDKGEPTVIVNDEDQPIVDSEDPSGNFSHTIFIINLIENKLEKPEYIHMCLGCHRNTSGCDRIRVYDEQNEIATIHVECLPELNFNEKHRLEYQPKEKTIFKEHDVVVDYHGRIGTIVHVYEFGAYEIEFKDGELKTVCLYEIEKTSKHSGMS